MRVPEDAEASSAHEHFAYGTAMGFYTRRFKSPRQDDYCDGIGFGLGAGVELSPCCRQRTVFAGIHNGAAKCPMIAAQACGAVLDRPAEYERKPDGAMVNQRKTKHPS